MEGRLQAAGRPFQTAPQGPLFRSLSAKKRRFLTLDFRRRAAILAGYLLTFDVLTIKKYRISDCPRHGRCPTDECRTEERESMHGLYEHRRSQIPAIGKIRPIDRARRAEVGFGGSLRRIRRGV